MMLSHIGDDHISSILELTGELVEAGKAPAATPSPRPLVNTFDDIIGNDPAELLARSPAISAPHARR